MGFLSHGIQESRNSRGRGRPILTSLYHFYTYIYTYITLTYYRSSHRRSSVRKVVLRNFTKFRGKHLCQSLFFNIVAGLRPATLLKKRLWHSCFLVNFGKFLRTPFLQNTFWRLLLMLAGGLLQRTFLQT